MYEVFACMSSQMDFHVTFLSERFLAYIALIGFLTSVSSNVFSKASRCPEGFVTCSARIRFLACVNHCVKFKGLLCSE